MKKILKPFDYIFILRPVLFFPVWAIFLAGYYGAGEQVVAASVSSMNGASADASGMAFLWVGAALTLLMGAIFVLQQVMERKSVSKSTKYVLVSPDHLTPKAAFIEAAVLAIGATIFSFALSWKIGLVFLSLLLVAGILYNFAPFSLRERPVPSLLVNGLGAFLIFGAGWILNGQLSGDFVLRALPYVCLIVAIYLTATIPDNDQIQPRPNNFSTKFGTAVTMYTALFFEVVAVALAFWLEDEMMFYPAFFSLPFFIWAVATLKSGDIVRATKYPLFLLGLAICFKWDIVYGNYWLFLVLIGVYVVSKLYYRFQFDANYPSL